MEDLWCYLTSHEWLPQDRRAELVSIGHREAEFSWGGGWKEKSRTRVPPGTVQPNSLSEEPWKARGWHENKGRKTESESSSLQPHGLYSPWNSPGQKTGVGSHSLLQGIFPIQGSNPGLPHCGQILYQLSHQGSPRILEWIAIAFSSGSFRPKNWTGVSCITHGFFTSWATREAPAAAAAAAAAKSLQSCPTLCDPINGQPTRLPHPWDSPGKSTGVGCHCLLQGSPWKWKWKWKWSRSVVSDSLRPHGL